MLDLLDIILSDADLKSKVLSSLMLPSTLILIIRSILTLAMKNHWRLFLCIAVNWIFAKLPRFESVFIYFYFQFIFVQFLISVLLLLSDYYYLVPRE